MKGFGSSRMEEDFPMAFIDPENDTDPHDSLLLDTPPVAEKQVDHDFFNGACVEQQQMLADTCPGPHLVWIASR